MKWIEIIFASWIFLIITCFVFFELKWNHDFMSEKKSTRHPYICSEVYKKLPNFTWNEFNERVQHGANFVVCGGLVVDVHKWMHSHPGGFHIIRRVVGSDITNDFYNKHQNISITEEFDEPCIPILSTEGFSRKNSTIHKYIHHLQGRHTVEEKSNFATRIDILNSNYYKKVPIAQHTHSKLAIQKMASMVIGKIEKVEKDHMSDKFSLITTSTGSQSSQIGYYNNELFSSIENKFHRYKLTSKAIVNVNKKIPIMRFTFTKIYQHKNYNNERFYPGNYVELFAKVKGQMVTRKYCPLEGTISKSFSIYVKIYSDGLLSRHLNKQLLGYEILVRGPFNIELSPYVGPLLFTPKGSLLNPNSIDGCWDELYMIAGGTGVTPMLQLIRYHLEQSAKQINDHYKMHLLYASDTVQDIIDGILLEDLALTSRGLFTVAYCLANPPDEWKGLSGIIDSNLITEWLSKMGCKLYPFLSEQQQSSLNAGTILFGHSIRDIDAYNFQDDQKKSTQPFISSLSQVNKEISEDFNNNKFSLQRKLSKQNSQLSSTLYTLSSALRTDNLQESSSLSSSVITTSEDETGSMTRAIRGISPLFDKNSGTITSHRKIIVCGPNEMIKVVENILCNMGFDE
ncbi:9443_t:CDS:2, partial [Racocetra persica]